MISSPTLPLFIFGGVWTQFYEQFSWALPKVAAAGGLLLVGWIIARVIRSVLQRVLSAAGLDRLAERLNDIDVIEKSGLRLSLSAIIAGTVYYILMLMFVVAATDVLGVPAITQLVTDLINYIPSLFTAAVVFLLGLFLADMIRSLVLTTLRSLGVPSAKMIATGVFYFLFITVAVSALAQARVDTDFIANNLTVLIAAGAGAFALGYGLASRHSVANYLAAHYNRDKVRVGDDVLIEGVRGKVVTIDNTCLVLQTDDRSVIIPLSKLTTGKIEIFYPEPEPETRDLLEGGAGADRKSIEP